MARRSDSSGCVRSIGSPWRGTPLKGVPGGPVHLNHVPLGVVEVERERPRWLMDRLIGTPLSMTRWCKACRSANEATSKAKYCNAGFAKNTSSTDPCPRMAAQKGSRARSSRIPADLLIDVTDASRRVLVRGMHDN